MLDLLIELTGTVSKIEDLQKIAKDIESKIQTGSRKLVTASADILQKSIIQAIYDKNIIASSQFLSSITTSSVFNLSTEQFNIQVGSSSPYAQYIEEGRSSGSTQPPLQVIYEWMITKGLEPSYGGAYLIARHIAEHGIEPKHPFETGFENALPLIEAEADLIMQETLNADTSNGYRD